MKKRLLCILCLSLMVCAGCGLSDLRRSGAMEGPEFHAFDEDGNELPMRELSDAEVEALRESASVAMSMADLQYFSIADEFFLDYARVSTPDFRNEFAKAAQRADQVGNTDEYVLSDAGYQEGLAINMEHFADMVDYYKDRNESVVVLIDRAWDPFYSEAYLRKFEAYASSFERADILQYWGESGWGESGEFGDESADEILTLGEAINSVPTGQYDHLLVALHTDHALRDVDLLEQQLIARDDFSEVMLFTYGAASLRAYPEAVAVLTKSSTRRLFCGP